MNLSSADVKVSLAEQAYDKIEHKIVTLELAPDTMISEKKLCEELGFGRTPVREALMNLEREGLIAIHSRRGAMVTRIDIMSYMELLEVRRPLQLLAARLGAVRATHVEREQLKELAQSISRTTTADDRNAFMDINRSIHEIEVSVAHNPILKRSLGLLQSLSRRFWFAYVHGDEDFRNGAKLHAQLLEVIADGESGSAEKSANKLINFLENLARREVERTLSPHISS